MSWVGLEGGVVRSTFYPFLNNQKHKKKSANIYLTPDPQTPLLFFWRQTTRNTIAHPPILIFDLTEVALLAAFILASPSATNTNHYKSIKMPSWSKSNQT